MASLPGWLVPSRAPVSQPPPPAHCHVLPPAALALRSPTLSPLFLADTFGEGGEIFLFRREHFLLRKGRAGTRPRAPAGTGQRPPASVWTRNPPGLMRKNPRAGVKCCHVGCNVWEPPQRSLREPPAGAGRDASVATIRHSERGFLSSEYKTAENLVQGAGARGGAVCREERSFHPAPCPSETEADAQLPNPCPRPSLPSAACAPGSSVSACLRNIFGAYMSPP